MIDVYRLKAIISLLPDDTEIYVANSDMPGYHKVNNVTICPYDSAMGITEKRDGELPRTHSRKVALFVE